jgi:hypothetical protein
MEKGDLREPRGSPVKEISELFLLGVFVCMVRQLGELENQPQNRRDECRGYESSDDEPDEQQTEDRMGHTTTPRTRNEATQDRRNCGRIIH